MDKHPVSKRDLYKTYSCGRSVRLRAESYRVPGATYFVTVCCRDKHPYLADSTVAEVVFHAWQEVAGNRAFRVWGLCVMLDHLHLLAECLDGTYSPDDLLRDAKSISLARVRGIAPLYWQAKGYDHIMRNDENPQDRLRYTVNNPVRRRLVDDHRVWPWTYVDPEAGL